MDEYLIFYTAFLSSIGALLIALWHDIAGKRIPPIEWMKVSDREEIFMQSKRSFQERGWFVFCIVALGVFLGVLVGLFIKGFMADELNNYAISFISLVTGFLMPNVLMYLEGLKIEKVISAINKN